MSDSGTNAKAERRGALIWVLRGLGVLVGLLVLAVLIAIAWVPSESGRRYIHKQIEEEASAGMGGSLEIGSLDEIKLFVGATGVRAKATDVRFLAPDGQEALHVVDADVTMGLADILKKTVNIREAIASKGTLTIEMDKNDKLTIENAFVREDGAPTSENVGLDLRHMGARHMRVQLKPGSEKSYNIVDIDGTVFVTRPEGGEFVTTELVDVHGTVENPKFLGHTLTFSKLKARIANDQTPMVEMTMLLKLDEGSIDTRLSVDPEGETPIKVRALPEGDAEVKLITSAAKIGSFFSSDVSIETDSKEEEKDEDEDEN